MLNARYALGLAALVVATVLGPWGPDAHAQITRDGTNLLVGDGGSGGMFPDVAFDDKHNVYLAVWGDGGTGGNRPAYAQLIARDGGLIGTKLALTSCGGELYGQKPKVAYSSGTADDVFVVVYREWCSGVIRQWAHLVRYSSGGVVSIGRTLIRDRGNPGGIVYNAARGEFATVWEESGNGFDVMFRAIPLTRSGGQVTGVGSLPAVVPVANWNEAQGLPDLALDSVNQTYFIVMQGEDPNSASLALFGRTMNAATYGLSPEFYITAGGYPVEASVAFMEGLAQFLVVWRNGGDIAGRRYTAGGVATTGIYPIIATPGVDGSSAVAYDKGVHRALAAGMNSDYRVWNTDISSTGAVASTFQGSSAAPSPPGGGTFYPKVAATNTGKFGMVYGIDYNRIYLDRFVNGSGGSVAPPPPPPPASLAVTLTSNVSFPQTVGTLVTFTATASGGTAPLQYQFVTYHANTGWIIAQPYSSNNKYTYYPGTGQNVVQAWVRNAGSTADYDAYQTSGYFEITGGAPVINSLTSNVTFPQPVGTSVTFTATASGGIGPLQYQFVTYHPNTGWIIAQPYSTTNKYSYFPGTGDNVLQVWVRSAGSTATYQDWETSGFFKITGSTPARLTSLTSNVTFPKPVGTLVTFTAAGTGGTGPVQYQFVTYHPNTGWIIAQPYSTTNTYSYYPGIGQNVLQAWVRSNGSTATYEDWKSSGYFNISSIKPAAGVTLSASTTFPKPAGTSVTFTGTAVGASAPVEYQFVTYNSSLGWKIARPYAASNAFAYTPPAGTNAVQVWVRNVGSLAHYDVWASSGFFTITP